MQRAVFTWLADELEDGSLESKTLVVRDRRLLTSLWSIFPYVYRLNDGSPALLQQVCKERGWKDFGESAGPWDEVTLRASQSWNLWWRSSIMNANRVTHLRHWQLTNHIPNASSFCRKDVLARYLRRLKSTYKSIYDFSPLSFNLPLEYTRFLAEHTKRQALLEQEDLEKGATDLGQKRFVSKGNKAPVWIAKPIGKSQGKGIIVFDKASGFSYDEPCVVQEYLFRPYLINGYKWDLRLYVCVTCPNPLTIYAYREGITRFATTKYDLKNLCDNFSHLTNTHVNKQSPTYRKNKETIGYGCKWTLRQLRRYFKEQGTADYFLWQRIWSILVLTIIGDAKDISRLSWNNSNFEFFGFDVMIDEQLKPHLLEVNVNPGLGSDTISSVDEEVKKPLLHDLFTLLGLPDGRDFEDLPFGLNVHKRFIQDQQTVLDQILGCCNEMETITPRKGYAKLLKSMAGREAKMIMMGNHVGISKYWSRGQNQPYVRDANNNGIPCGYRMSYQRIETADYPNNQILSPRKNRRRIKEEKIKVGPGPQIIPPIAVRIPVLRSPREKVLPKFAVNGPGLNLAPRDWDVAQSPVTSGNWVRIFPFDTVTGEKARFNSEDCVRSSIYQVSEYLRLVREVVRSTDSSDPPDDDVYDEKIQTSGALTTPVWHPFL